MRELDSDTEDQLDPDVPSPREELLDKATDNGAKDGASNRGEDDEGDCVLLFIWFPPVDN